MENHFVDSYYPTVENTFIKTVKMHGQTYTCEIVDTAGQDEYSIMQSSYAIGVHGYVLIYSITSRATLEMTKVIRDKILNLVGVQTVPMILVGNKCDLHVQREVSREEAEELGRQWRVPVVETSAKLNENIGNL